MSMSTAVTPRSRNAKRNRSASGSRSFKSAVPRSIKNYSGVCNFTRTATAAFSIASGAGIVVNTANYTETIITFSPLGYTMWGSTTNSVLVALPNAAEIGALWDRLKIDKVVLQISGINVDAVSSAAAPRILIGNDYSGPNAGSQTDTSIVQQLASCTYFNVAGDQPVAYWTCKPKFQRLVQYTSTSSSTEPATGFVDPTVEIPHYGVRIGIPSTLITGAARLNISAKFYFSAKNIK